VAVGVVWETTAQRALDGHAAGASDAAIALAQAHACGMPPGRPVYVAVDFDTTEADQVRVDDYFRGWNTVIPAAQTGVYGGYWTVSRTMGAGLAHFGWQTSAWSGGQWYAGALLQQRGGNILIGGVDCDRNTASGDVGLWHPVGSTPIPAPVPASTYTVEPGDTLTSIAVHLGVTLGALEAANPQVTNPNLITIGQVLHVPGHPGPTPVKTYVVKPGDTLSAIAVHLGVTLAALEAANPQVSNPDLIWPGQVLHVP
jgi:LysM repeat protein